ncbi:GH39 family glycosyl hydrolase [Nonomuraea jiangxiensis]|uniref:Xylan 1,4-beta-xylosidase n=1 Tax=Nonomuraea jiangxiensis TaxID=633440 RepID=A0A1G9SST2_9ACTN|nr:xylan 1,4-beta-xylosidase [Nonomuraea jiangxiensis]SDM38492.1 xylan 1,4-beta-xylosidase [Nonomuraea jiangxiensis]
MNTAAHHDWQDRIGQASGEPAAASRPGLEAPTGLRAVPGVGQVTLTWDPVPGAIGYLVHRDGAPAAQPDVDVPAVPSCRFVDTGHGAAAYSVAAVSAMDHVGPLSPEVHAEPLPAAPGAPASSVSVRVDARRVTGEPARPWAYMVGSEHLSHLLSTDETGGRPIGEELAGALRIVRDELGVQTVRAHAILCDDLGVYKEVDGRAVHDFSRVDEVYDTVVALGLRPIVELSYMPRDLAADPTKTVFGYGAIVSPPKDFEAWSDLVRALVEHLADRYGIQELIDHWAFEVWNEPNLAVFWSGTPEEYFLLYDVTAAAVKYVHPDLRVGGPASAANGWVEELLAHVAESGAALDFLSTHTYGNAPLDWRPALARYGMDVPVWWTEWGPTPTHFHGVGDGPFGASFLLHGMKSAAGRIAALSHWVASDHFEELGRPPRLFHGGFGLLTVGNLRKPRFHALTLAARLGDAELAATLDGDVGGVEVWAARHDDGRIGVLVWNGTLNHAQAAGAPELARTVTLTVDGLDGARTLTHHRIDAGHSNVEAAWQSMGGGDWPAGEQWDELRAGNTLEELAPARRVEGGTVTLEFELPMPGVSFIELTP